MLTVIVANVVVDVEVGCTALIGIAIVSLGTNPEPVFLIRTDDTDVVVSKVISNIAPDPLALEVPLIL